VEALLVGNVPGQPETGKQAEKKKQLQTSIQYARRRDRHRGGEKRWTGLRSLGTRDAGHSHRRPPRWAPVPRLAQLRRSCDTGRAPLEISFHLG
jgi:hypothetical protein